MPTVSVLSINNLRGEHRGRCVTKTFARGLVTIGLYPMENFGLLVGYTPHLDNIWQPSDLDSPCLLNKKKLA